MAKAPHISHSHYVESITPSTQLCLVSSISGFLLPLVRPRKPGGTAISVPHFSRFEMGMQSLKAKAGVLKCSRAEFAVTQAGRCIGRAVRRQMQHLHLGFCKPLIYTVGSLSCPCVRRCLRVKMILSQHQEVDVSE